MTKAEATQKVALAANLIEETREIVKTHKTISDFTDETVPMVVEKPNTPFLIPYPENVSDDGARRTFRNKLRISLGKALNSRKKMLARSLFISELDEKHVKVFLQDLDRI